MENSGLLDSIAHPPADLDGVIERLLQMQVAHQRAQRAAVDVLGDHVRLAEKRAQVVGADDVGMAAKPYPQFGLGVEAGNRLVVPEELVLEGLDRYSPAPLPVVGDVDDPHMATAYLLDLEALLDHIADVELAPEPCAAPGRWLPVFEQPPQHSEPSANSSSKYDGWTPAIQIGPPP